jgi:tetratricopeptide (TPR) repeat protein
MTEMLQFIISNKKIDQLFIGSELYNAIGSFYWLLGEIHIAIEYLKKGKNNAIEKNNNRFHIISLLNLGLCYLDLFLIDDFLDVFIQYIDIVDLSVLAIEQPEKNG